MFFLFNSLISSIFNWSFKFGFLFHGLTGLSIYYGINILLIRKESKNIDHWINAIFGLTALVIPYKYLNYSIFDIPALIIIPVFLITSSLYLLKKLPGVTPLIKTQIVTLIFILLIIPMLFRFDEIPRKLIVDDWISENINDKNKRNENWSWFINEDTGKGKWVPIGEETTADSGDYFLFYHNDHIMKKGRFKNKIEIDTTCIYNLKGETIKYLIHNSNSTKTYYPINGKYEAHYATGEIMEKGIISNHEQQNWVGISRLGNILMKKVMTDSLYIKTYYYESGQIKDSASYDNENKLQGISQKWYKNGLTKSRIEWNNGLQEGETNYYFENGQIKRKSFYKKGHINGKVASWYTNSQIRATGNKINDEFNGEFKQWYSNGNLEIIGNFKNGLRHGLFTIYHENGNLKRKVTFHLNKANGNIERYNEDGILIKVETFTHGQLIENEKAK